MKEGGHKPVMLLDDISSEFDQEHLKKLLGYLTKTECQIWITDTNKRLIKQHKTIDSEYSMFHVKQGKVVSN